MTGRATLATALALLAAAIPLCAAPAAAQESVRPMTHTTTPGTLRVSATGESRAAPDRAWIDFGLETMAATAEAAGRENAQRMERVIAVLVRAGVPREQIQTRDYSVHPEYAPPPDARTEEPRIRGYRVTNTVSVTVDRVGEVGGLIDAALAAGANRVHGVRFGLRDPEAVRARALQEAVRRGRAEAETLAAALGVGLGRLLDASTMSEPYRPPVPMMMEMAASRAVADAATPVEPGEQTVAASVHLVYAIEPR